MSASRCAANYGSPTGGSGNRYSSSTESDPIHVLIIDDHAVFAESLRLALVAQGLLAERVTHFDVPSVERAVEIRSPQVVLMDVELGTANGADLVPAAQRLGARVIVLTGIQDRLKLAACVHAGAQAIIDKTEPLDRLAESIRRAAAGEVLMPVAVREQLLSDRRSARAAEDIRRQLFERLTTREAEVLAELAHGKKVSEIALESFVSVVTVRAQVRSILRKLGVSSQLEAVVLAYKHHWTSRTTSQPGPS